MNCRKDGGGFQERKREREKERTREVFRRESPCHASYVVQIALMFSSRIVILTIPWGKWNSKLASLV
jgi:hypothetical protein